MKNIKKIKLRIICQIYYEVDKNNIKVLKNLIEEIDKLKYENIKGLKKSSLVKGKEQKQNQVI